MSSSLFSSSFNTACRSNISQSLLLCLPLIAASLMAGCTKKVVVPNVVDQDVDQAVKTLSSVPLNANVVSGPPNGTPGAYVVSQTPTAGQQVAAKSPVALIAEAPVLVPKLMDIGFTEAVKQLQDLHLRAGFQTKASLNPFKRLRIEGQTPEPNTPVHRDTLVTLTVSRSELDVSALLALVAKEPAYQNLKPEYKNILDAFLGNPGVPRSMEPESTTEGYVPSK
jgi:beta-lactam-binding protein with PASTA domain